MVRNTMVNAGTGIYTHERNYQQVLDKTVSDSC